MIEDQEASKKSRGLFMEVKFDKKNEPIEIICNPQKWSTYIRKYYIETQVEIFLIGHLYAKRATSFNPEISIDILHDLYSKHGFATMKDEIAGGMYSIVIYDKRKGKIFAFCDVLACMPLYYKADIDSFVLATDQNDIGNRNSIDQSSCLEYLHYGFLPFADSLFMDVRRFCPGQILTMDLSASRKWHISDECFPQYIPLSDRISDKDYAVDVLSNIMRSYFNRLGNERIASGLSGGYDSRLLAAYLGDKNPRFVTFVYPNSEEATIATSVAEHLNTTTHVFSIPSNSPSAYLDDFLFGMSTADNLGSSHVFSLLHELLYEDPEYLVDGFLGGAVLGGAYYYKLYGKDESFFSMLTMSDAYENKKKSVDEYLQFCLDAYGNSIPVDNELYEPMIASRKEYLNKVLTHQFSSCITHADMLEMILYRFRSRNYISSGPVTFLRKRNTLLPYYDIDFFQTCMSIKKSLRAGDRLFNAFWRKEFKDMSHIQKDNTGGCPNQSDIAYRYTHIYTALSRRIRDKLFHNKKASGDLNSFIYSFCHDSDNSRLFSAVNEETVSWARNNDLNFFIDQGNVKNSDLEMRLRAISLLAILNESHT